jgi:hypothetical protein
MFGHARSLENRKKCCLLKNVTVAVSKSREQLKHKFLKPKLADVDDSNIGKFNLISHREKPF